MKIFITGSNGFVGSRLMWELEALGHEVIGIDRSPDCLYKVHPSTYIGDILNTPDLEASAPDGADLLIHCAAEKHDFGLTREQYFLVNEQGTQNLLEWADTKNIIKVINYSSVGVYGYRDDICDETATNLNPGNTYGESKLAQERKADEWALKDASRQLINLRPSIIYGPYNYANMYNLINVMHKTPWVMIGKGDHVKTMVSLSNLVDMTIFAIDQLKPGIEVYNCIDKPYITLWKLMKIIALNPGFSLPHIKIPLAVAVGIGKVFDVLGKILNKDLPVNSERMRKFATATNYRSEKIRQHGYVQRYTIEGEMARTCQWYLQNNK